MKIRSLSVPALAAALVVSTGGCAFFRGGDRPTAVEVTLTAADRLNPDERGESLPTMFRIQLLGAAARAEAASYEAVYRGDKEVLGEDLLAQEEVFLSPGQTVKKRIVADKPARALMVVGIFRRPTGTSWRAIVPIERGRPRSVSLRAEDYRVERR
jgi:type VI secretion system protein VasD